MRGGFGKKLLVEMARCRRLTESDNAVLMNEWIVENKGNTRRGDFLTLVKGKKSHFILLQNGNIDTSSSGRFRTGIWFGGEQHVSSFKLIIGGRSSSELFRKQVRTPGYTYRQYVNAERIDYAPFGKPCIATVLRCSKSEPMEIRMRMSHRTMWPENRIADAYSLVELRRNAFVVRSSLAETLIKLSGSACTFTLRDGELTISVHGRGPFMLSVGKDGNSASLSDLQKNEQYHSYATKNCVLQTPSFEINKCFLWAKHDLTDFYSEGDQGSGFYAGMPEFSWFFGRDGEWMSMAAIECGLWKLADAHLRTLERHSVKGRIPHEIPLVAPNRNQKHGIGPDEMPTRFMSIDSTPLWILTEMKLRRWHGKGGREGMLKRAIRFCLSCDRDGDGLIENSFRDGLIGWPESWARDRDGACIEVNAWWLRALEEYGASFGWAGQYAERGMSTFLSTFFGRSDAGFTAFDSIYRGVRRSIRTPMEIVPAMYWTGETMKSLVDWLTADDIITPWGVRSMSSADPMYDRGYHTGEVWPLMTGWFSIAAFRNDRPDVAFDLLKTFPMLAFSSPEPGRINEVYNPEYLQPMGQFAQGWSSSLFIQAVIEGLFGMEPDGRSGVAGIAETTHPHLPVEWDSMRLRRVLYRGRHYDISVDRNGLRVTSSDG
jgi:glycogen debranching enzyme